MVQILFLSEEAIGMISSIDFSLQPRTGWENNWGSNLSGSLEWWSDTSMEGQGEPSDTPGDKRDIFPNTSIGGGYIWENQDTQNRFMVANLH